MSSRMSVRWRRDQVSGVGDDVVVREAQAADRFREGLGGLRVGQAQVSLTG